MGWMRTILLGDIGNRLDIADTEEAINKVARQHRTTAKKLKDKEVQVSQLTSELAQQKLAIQALTRFLVSKEIISEDELNEFIKEVDAEDGVIDGKMTLNPEKSKLVYRKPKPGDGQFGKVDWT